nr:Chain A, MBH12 [synthetic construct]1K43_A Chain A, MBH12 [synthetic construct]
RGKWTYNGITYEGR